MTSTDTRSHEVIAHRCRGFDHPDQSVRAIDAALACGARVHLAARLTSDTRWVLPVQETATTVRKIHTNTAARLRGIALPLEHALALLSARAHTISHQGPLLYLELKDRGGEAAAIAALKKNDLLDRTVLVAWDPAILRRCHALSPTVRLGVALVPLEHALRSPRTITHAHRPRRHVTLAYDPAQRFDAVPGVGATPIHSVTSEEIAGLPLCAVFIPAILSRVRTIERIHHRGAQCIATSVHNRLFYRVLRERGIDAVLSDHAGVILTRAKA